jgi:RNA polymerase sigma-70 factor (ECF subfamily)
MGPERISDADLWKRVIAHDGRAFAELFDRHSKSVYNHCFRRTADWSMAEDLTSVVFLEAWRLRKKVRLHDDSVLPWLLAVANNCARNATRSRSRYRRLLAKLPGPDSSDALDTEAIGRADDESAMRRVLTGFGQLSADDQEVIALCDWADLTYEEAATALDAPVGTVKSRLSRARGRLRALLEPTAAPMTPDHGGDGNV